MTPISLATSAQVAPAETRRLMAHVGPSAANVSLLPVGPGRREEPAWRLLAVRARTRRQLTRRAGPPGISGSNSRRVLVPTTRRRCRSWCHTSRKVPAPPPNGTAGTARIVAPPAGISTRRYRRYRYVAPAIFDGDWSEPVDPPLRVGSEGHDRESVGTGAVDPPQPPCPRSEVLDVGLPHVFATRTGDRVVLV